MNEAYYNAAQALRVVDVFTPGNETGWVTPAVLYNASVKHTDGKTKAPVPGTKKSWHWHGTVGTNTLAFWCQSKGSIQNGSFSLTNYLVPHNQTRYADGKMHDTRNVVFKMAPDNRACNHLGNCIAPYSNNTSFGVEYESLQNGTHDFENEMYIKGALIQANSQARFPIPDHHCISHGTVALPNGRRSDPWAGQWDFGYHWSIVQEIRRDGRIWRLWGLPQPVHR
jgi:hypothetical protein